MSEHELYLIYVAITRAKKTRGISDELYAALKTNLAFTLNKAAVPECLLDNIQIPTVNVQSEQPEDESVHVSDEHAEEAPVKQDAQTEQSPLKNDKPKAANQKENPSSLESSTLKVKSTSKD